MNGIDPATSSDPSSPRYGQHYTTEQVHELFAPRKDTVDKVREWLQSSGIEADRISQSVNKQWMQFDATVREMEDLVKTEYHHYAHYGTGKSNIGCDK